MSYTRTLVSPATGGLDLRIDYAQIRVIVGGTDRIEVELSTEGPADGDAAKAIQGATIATVNAHDASHSVGSGDEVARRGDGTYAKVVVPDQPPTVIQSGGSRTVFRGGVGAVYSNVGRNMSVVGNRVFVNGVEVKPDGTQSGIRALVRLPADVDLRLDTDGADVVHEGEALYRVVSRTVSGDLALGTVFGVRARSISGNLRVRVASHVELDSTSGDLRAGAAGRVAATSVSGDITVGHLTGDASCRSTSGDVTLTAAGRADGRRQEVLASTVSGDIEVRDPNGLYNRGLLSVSPSSVSGDIEAPGYKAKDNWGW